MVQDGVAMLWDLAEGKRLYNLEAGEIIHALCFSPNRYWLCAATTNFIKVTPSPTHNLHHSFIPLLRICYCLFLTMGHY